MRASESSQTSSRSTSLILDTHPGINEETLLSIAMSNTLLIILRPDRQDYEGTRVTVAVARKLGVPQMMLVVNKAPSVFEPDAIRRRVEETYDCPVAAVLPHSDDLMVLSSEGVFSLRYPDHPLTGLYRDIAAAAHALMSDDELGGFLDREQMLGGSPERRAATLLFLIETRTARALARSRVRGSSSSRTDASEDERGLAFVEGLRARTGIDRRAERLRPRAAGRRLGVARSEQRATFRRRWCGASARSTGSPTGSHRASRRRSASTEGDVRDAYGALYGQPIEAASPRSCLHGNACAGRGRRSPGGSRTCHPSGWRTRSRSPRRWAGRSWRCRSRSPSSARSPAS